MHKEDVILPQVMQKRLPRQRAVAQPRDESVPRIAVPIRPGGLSHQAECPAIGHARSPFIGRNHSAVTSTLIVDTGFSDGTSPCAARNASNRA